jgi:hypothetical protein
MRNLGKCDYQFHPLEVPGFSPLRQREAGLACQIKVSSFGKRSMHSFAGCRYNVLSSIDGRVFRSETVLSRKLFKLLTDLQAEDIDTQELKSC